VREIEMQDTSNKIGGKVDEGVPGVDERRPKGKKVADTSEKKHKGRHKNESDVRRHTGVDDADDQ
jgi:hypothetical protein